MINQSLSFLQHQIPHRDCSSSLLNCFSSILLSFIPRKASLGIFQNLLKLVYIVHHFNHVDATISIFVQFTEPRGKYRIWQINYAFLIIQEMIDEVL